MVEPSTDARDPLDQLLLDLRDLGWLAPSDVLLLSASVAALTAERDQLREAVQAAATELDNEHATDMFHGGCVICWPKDGGRPCLSRMVADDLRAALTQEQEPTDR